MTTPGSGGGKLLNSRWQFLGVAFIYLVLKVIEEGGWGRIGKITYRLVEKVRHKCSRFSTTFKRTFFRAFKILFFQSLNESNI